MNAVGPGTVGIRNVVKASGTQLIRIGRRSAIVVPVTSIREYKQLNTDF